MGARRGCAVLAALAFLLSQRVESGTLRPLEAKTRYREILGTLADGQRQEALSDLVEFEQAAVGDDRAWRSIEAFWKLKLQVIRDLLEDHSSELLRPIIVLHHDAYFEYVKAGRRYLAGHSRAMAGELAEVYAERAGTREAGLFSGWVLTSFGAHLWSPSAIRESADLFFRAYQVDPGNEIAVLGLAAAFEKSGDYKKAIEYLSRALLIEPSNTEVRLRLALCQLRSKSDRSRQARAHLTALTGDGSPAWIRSIAFQELARADLEEGREELAETSLREALGILPGDQQLSLQLATILDRQRRRDEAISILEAIEVNGWQHDSSRERYDVWEPPGVEEARAEYLGAMEEGLVALETGLVSVPTEEEGE